VTDKHKGKG